MDAPSLASVIKDAEAACESYGTYDYAPVPIFKLHLEMLINAVKKRQSVSELTSLKQGETVLIPKTEEQAAAYVILGTQWLKENAPHRLKG